MEKSFVESCKEHREEILKIEKAVRELWLKKEGENSTPGEQFANVMLAVRHLEDARMRLGKAIQAHEGRESIYPG